MMTICDVLEEWEEGKRQECYFESYVLLGQPFSLTVFIIFFGYTIYVLPVTLFSQLNQNLSHSAYCESQYEECNQSCSYQILSEDRFC